MRLPALRAGAAAIAQEYDPARPVPLVDESKRLTGAATTLFQRMNEQGDMLRAATTVVGADGKRAIGTYIPAVNPDGEPNPVVKAVLAGQTYVGRAFVVNQWYMTAYEPLTSDQGRVVGMLFAGIPEAVAINLVRGELNKWKIGKTGYVYVLNGSGKTRGHYVISKGGARDGENLWNSRDADGRYFIREICQGALQLQPGKGARFRYMWRNPGDAAAQAKLVHVRYFKAWDWVIGVGAPEVELAETANLIAAESRRAAWQFAFVLALACAGSALAW